MGKTVTTECAYFHPGKTRNPHNPAHTPGGIIERIRSRPSRPRWCRSHSAADQCSVIRPASFCGVYGFKPTHGLIPRTGVPAAFAHARPRWRVSRARSRDVALIAEELAGWDEGDPDTHPRARIPFRDIAAEERRSSR
jgi:Asp-tRNA(Asn)/Glu-tRNA(Gln) amidotransferase A subunit family amidase